MLMEVAENTDPFQRPNQKANCVCVCECVCICAHACVLRAYCHVKWLNTEAENNICVS